mgnify:CR=1 FL=1
MPKAAHKVVVIGHRNPDTDSICSAIAYAELKNKTSDLVCEPRRAGKMNQETEFVLKKFGVKPPRMCTDVNPKIRDVDYREMPGIPGSTSLRKRGDHARQADRHPAGHQPGQRAGGRDHGQGHCHRQHGRVRHRHPGQEPDHLPQYFGNAERHHGGGPRGRRVHHRPHPHRHRHARNAGKYRGKRRHRHPDQPLRKPAVRH